MKNVYFYCLVAGLLSACSADSATRTTDQVADAATSSAAEPGTEAAPSATPTAAAASDAAPAGAPATNEHAADPTAAMLPEEPCLVLTAADAAAALGTTSALQPVTNHNDVMSKCLYQTAPDAQGATTTLLTLEWTRDIASHQAYASSKKGLALLNMTPNLVPGLGQEAFWGIESELMVQLPGGMLTVRATGNSPPQQRAHNLKVARLVLPRL